MLHTTYCLNQESTPDEKMVAGLFLIPTPGKFAKPFLKHADDVGGAINTGKKTKNTTTLWDIKSTADKRLKYRFNGQQVTAYRDPNTKLWWSKDITGHGGSEFKVFRETKGGNELQWVADADKYGNYILNKHKSQTGVKIKLK